MSIVQKCMAIMSIIITEEDLCKKLAKKCAKICQFSSLPSKCFQAMNDPNTENDSKPHICAYNCNRRTGFRDHKKIWGSRVLSSTLTHSRGTRSELLHRTYSKCLQLALRKRNSKISGKNILYCVKFCKSGINYKF